MKTAEQILTLFNTKESRIIGHIQQLHLTEERNNIYIALEELEDADFFWSGGEIEEFDFLWKTDKPINEIAKELGRTEVAVFLLAFDRVLRGMLPPREGWRIW